MNPDKILAGEESNQGRLQFLGQVFPEELREIMRRHGTDEKFMPSDEALKNIKEAEEAFYEAEKKVKELNGIHSVIYRLKQILLFFKKQKRKAFSAHEDECINEYKDKRAKLEELIETVKPSSSYGLTGLAFSGGGIRSATFNLGVLQALAKNGILKNVDYLSTVSGGGYIGSCLSSLCNVDTVTTEWDRFPFRHIPGQEEPDAIKKLRNSSNYLAPGGFLDKIRIPALLLRGILINFLVLLPYIILSVWVTDLMFGDKLNTTNQNAVYILIDESLETLKHKGCPPDILKKLESIAYKRMQTRENTFKIISETIGPKQANKYGSMIVMHAKRTFDWKTYYKWTPWAACAFTVWVLLFPLAQWFHGRFGKRLEWSWRNRYGLSFGVFLVIVFLVAFIESLPVALLYLKYNWWDRESGDLWTLLTSILALIPYAFSDKASKNVSKWTGKLMLLAMGLLGPMILLLIFLRLSYWNIFYFYQGYLGLIEWPYIYLGAFVLWCFTCVFVDVNSTSLHGFYRDRLSKAYLFQVLPVLFKIKDHIIANLKNKGTPDKVLGRLKNKPPHEFLNQQDLETFLKDLKNEQVNSNRVEITRDAVSKEKIEFNDTQKLQDLNKANSVAPYHLINVVLNLQNSNDRNLRGRNSDFFMFSKHFTGCERTGFCETRSLEKADPHLNLGTAMAISGAAAAPNMGTITVKPLVFIMAMFNIRLGYWLPNPGYVFNSKTMSRRWIGVGPFYLLIELFGRMNENGLYVNVSDGGHIENTGIYELLRRRCKFIIAGDAEADPDLSFGGLAKLIRYARIDMGIDIDIELEEVRKQTDGLSRKHCALGTIQYGQGETGYLLYIKSSLTGDENEYIHQYRASNPSFPHESTADQFFDESQFEVYRALGYHIVNELFEKRDVDEIGPIKYDNMLSWFKSLRPYLRPRFQMEESFIELQDQLTIIENQFKDPDVQSYTLQIYPEIVPDGYDKNDAAGIDDEQFRKIFHLCNQQMQIMENVFIALHLDTLRNRDHHFNRGWMNLFRRWAQAPFFRRAWAVSIGTYCVGFQIFCEEALKLKSGITWSPGQEENLTPREKDYLDEEIEKGRFRSEEVMVKNSERASVDTIWQAKMGVFNTSDELVEPFPVGFATLRKTHNNIDLMFYRIRDYYREMQLLDKMVPALKEHFPKDYSFRVDFSERPEEQYRYTHFFERHGFGVIDGGTDNP